MSKYNPDNIEDLKEFIGLLTGDAGYFPDELFDFDATLLGKAMEKPLVNRSAQAIFSDAFQIACDELTSQFTCMEIFHFPDNEKVNTFVQKCIQKHFLSDLFKIKGDAVSSYIEFVCKDKDVISVMKFLDEETGCFSYFQEEVPIIINFDIVLNN